MPAPIELGQSDFVSLREGGKAYVDKSGFIPEVIRAPAQVALYPRPRRFGKTLNLSMLRAWFEIGPDRTAIFDDLAVWSDADARGHFQAHPVIYLTFKDLKQTTWTDARTALDALLSAEVDRHRAAIEDPRLPASTRARLLAVLNRAGDQGRVLLDLTEALCAHHGARVVVLVDEYDAGLLSAWEHGYYDEAVGFFRSLLSAGLKDNPFLFRGVLTGILRVARESMFSGLNNVEIYSILQPRAGEHFGFTEPEVCTLLASFGRTAELDSVREWYNGYVFGDATVYNPLSIMSTLAYPERPRTPYWLNTSENSLARSLLLNSADLSAAITRLTTGDAIVAPIDEDLALRDLGQDDVWSLLLYSGYLKATHVQRARGRTSATLSIPNLEVRTLWEGTFARWLRERSGGTDALHAALLGGDAARVETILAEMLLRHVSVHDVVRTQDEAFYHAFVLGLLVTLEPTHAVRSNRETGLGRADLLIVPKVPGLPGVVLEFKRGRPGRRLATIAAGAARQLAEQGYTAELQSAGASAIHGFGVAFSGKDVAVRRAALG